MAKKIIVAIVALAFILGVIIPALANDKSKQNGKKSSQLVAALPASDGVVSIDLKRIVDEALPQILSANQPKLTEILGKLEEFKSKTGVDLTRFEQLAIGIKAKKLSNTKYEMQPIVLASGGYDSGALIAVAKFVSKGKYREETIGTRTIYIFSIKEIAADNKPNSDNSFIESMIDKLLGDLGTEFALTSFDSNTLAFGSVARMRELLESKTRVSTPLMDLVFKNQTAIMSFGANLPKGMAGFLGTDNPEVDKNIDSIRQFYGSMDVDGANTNVGLTAKTSTVKTAEDLELFLKGMSELGKVLLGSSKGADKKVYSRMLGNLTVARNTTEVSIEIKVPQTDLDVIVGQKK